MKVAITSRAILKLHGYGGMERYVYFFAKYLAENGVEVTLLTARAANQDSFTDFNGVKNLELVCLGPNINRFPPFLRPIFYRIFLKNVASYLKKQKISVVHSFGLCPPEYFRASRRAPVVVEPFGSEEFVNRKKESWLRKTYLDLFLRNPKMRSMRSAEAIASEGERQTEEIVELFGIPRGKIFLLPDGVDLHGATEAVKNSTLTRGSYGLQDADIVLMNMNRLAKNKGVTYLIDALKIVNKKMNAKLILVGTGPEEQKLEQQIDDLGLKDKVVRFKNISDEMMFQLYALADVSVTPTLYEGLPLVILEAMACGKPIIASNVSEVPQVVRDGENGFLVPPRNPVAIAEAVGKIRDRNLFEAMGKRSLAIIQDYDWNAIAKKAIEKYEKLVGPSSTE